LMRLFHHLADECNSDGLDEDHSSRLNFMLSELRRVSKPGSIIVLISDFLGIDDSTPSLVSPLVRHNDLMAFWIYDQSEIQSWPSGQYQLLADKGQLSLDLSAQAGVDWLQGQQQTHRQSIETLASQFNIWQHPVSCNQDITSQLAGLLGNRRAR